MMRRPLIKYVAYLLLFAIQFAAVPFHQIFHKHHTTSCHDKTGITSLKEYEKACCKPFDGIFGTDKVSKVISLELSSVVFFYMEYNSPVFSAQFFQFSNKAPPVAIA